MGSWDIVKYALDNNEGVKKYLLPDKHLKDIKSIDEETQLICNYTRYKLFSYIISNPQSYCNIFVPPFLKTFVEPYAS